ncbi:hypothetical protein Prudu_017335, partial [Prunus dulcis]
GSIVDRTRSKFALEFESDPVRVRHLANVGHKRPICPSNKTSLTRERHGRRKNGPVVSVTQSQPEPQTGRIQGTVVSLIRNPGSHGPGVPKTREANVKCTDKTEGRLDARGHRHIRRQHILKATVSVTGYPRWFKKI